MARWKDWVALADSTVRSLQAHEVAKVYSIEWPEAKKVLIQEHSSDIEGERDNVKRFVRTVSAILYGLTRRLTPQRRLLFVVAQLLFVFCLVQLVLESQKPELATIVTLFVSSTLMTLLLGLELIDKIKIRDELELARDLQASLIPKHLPRSQHYELAAFNRIANTVGGDIYDFVPLPDGRLAVLFGDASGHGMAAGLVMAVAHAGWRNQLEVDASPQAVFSAVNRILCRTGSQRSFFSACYLLLSPDGSFEMIMAGHPELLRVSRTGKVVERIGYGAYPLGIKPLQVWRTLEGRLEPLETLVLHSDGLTEARNSAGRDLGDAHLETVIGWHPGAGARDLLDELVAEWQTFCGDVPPDDDVTIAVIQRR